MAFRILMRTALIVTVTVNLFAACDEKEAAVPFNPPTEDRSVSNIIEDQFRGQNYVVYANSNYGVMTAFSSEIEGTVLDFEVNAGGFPEIMTDNEGNHWNIFGFATRGPREGQMLTHMNATMGYFFSFGAFFPEVTLYDGPEGEFIDQKTPGETWLVNREFVFIGAPKDGIPSIDQPDFFTYRTAKNEKIYIDNSELVITYYDGEAIKIVPHKVLDWHEIVNDETSYGKTVISYCPLTGTSNVWKAMVNGEPAEYGVSGFLYNNNLVLYDRKTDTKWSQIFQEGISGSLVENRPEVLHYAEMTFSAAKELGEILLVLSENTGFSRDYDRYPYGDYKTNHENIGFPLTYEDDRIPAKERVLNVVIDGRSKIYRFNDFIPQN